MIISPPRTCCREELNRKDVELKSKGVITSVEAQRALVVGGGVSDSHVTTEGGGGGGGGGGGAAVLGAQRIAQLEARLKSAMVRIYAVCRSCLPFIDMFCSLNFLW